LGTQETMSFQADYLQEHFAEYQRVGKLREPTKSDSEQCTVFFRRERFVDLEQGHFWLSQTPDTPASKSWDSSLPRMVTWLKLYDQKARRSLYFFNTHFDHRGVEARRQAAQLLTRRVGSLDPLIPVVVTGDFNCGEDSPPYQALLPPDVEGGRLQDAYRVARPTRQPDEGTFNGFQGSRRGSRIDWILISPHFRVESAEIVVPAADERIPSDHFPVTAVLSLDISDGE
jgi:endonuclease/exonuclease/phosphatase family metal-dependent hydrolase